MSCSFWNMRRKLRAQAEQKDKIITDIAKAQKEEAKADAEKSSVAEKPTKKGGGKNGK